MSITEMISKHEVVNPYCDSETKFIFLQIKVIYNRLKYIDINYHFNKDAVYKYIINGLS